MKTALLLGATGLTGSSLLQLLLNDRQFEKVRIFVRHSTGLVHSKLEEFIVDFDQPDSWRTLLEGDVLFSALGTTLKQAGSKAAQYKVDYHYQYDIARIAAENNVSQYVLVSSMGADSRSRYFYLRMKGQLEEAVAALPFGYIYLLQAGPIAGIRKDNRPLASFINNVLLFLTSLGLLRQYRPVRAENLALAMLHVIANKMNRLQRYSSLEVHWLAGYTFGRSVQ